MSVNKADVYRKAAEIIVRDGMYKGALVDTGDPDTCPSYERQEQALVETSAPVCALGACARAEYELYGTLPRNTELSSGRLDPYEHYNFSVMYGDSGTPYSIHGVNDLPSTSAEDIALHLKNRAEEVECTSG